MVTQKELQESWVGDRLQIVSTGEIGLFDSVKSDGHAVIKIGKRLVEVAPANLQLAPVEEKQSRAAVESTAKEFAEEKFDLNKNLAYPREIDLHMEKLAPSMIGRRDEHVLEIQLDAARNYLLKAHQLRVKEVYIIHGIGKGILKQSLQELLIEMPEVQGSSSTYSSKYGEGALKILMSASE